MSNEASEWEGQKTSFTVRVQATSISIVNAETSIPTTIYESRKVNDCTTTSIVSAKATIPSTVYESRKVNDCTTTSIVSAKATIPYESRKVNYCTTTSIVSAKATIPYESRKVNDCTTTSIVSAKATIPSTVYESRKVNDCTTTSIVSAKATTPPTVYESRKKYWVEKEANRNCFMVFARDLSITWGNDSSYWNWTNLKESTSEEFVDVAELVNVCWLDVSGKFEITKLSPGVKYEVAFEVMLKEPCYGWDVLVNIRFTPPDGNKKVRQENLKEKPKGRWIEIPVGDFTTPSLEKGGEIEFSLYEHEGGKWKKGLVVKGVVIRPKH